jgi:hypothetical protein
MQQQQQQPSSDDGDRLVCCGGLASLGRGTVRHFQNRGDSRRQGRRLCQALRGGGSVFTGSDPSPT